VVVRAGVFRDFAVAQGDVDRRVHSTSSIFTSL